ncbi:hypothetical protein Pcaca05_40120 [Pectobacterium carotovorum subsp. carotovorum]|nr:hypothetical protein Pcaca05_40120 [Pectobacterium carotovorum subsp. carotovorum]
MREKWRKCMHVVFVGLIMMSTANAAEEPLRIRSVFDINSAFCAIKTNGVIGMDNRHSAVAGRGFGTSSTNSLLFLENGENEITVEIGALGWFSPETIGDEARGVFKPDARCKVALTAFKGEQSKVLSQLTIAIGQDGLPYAQSGGEGGANSDKAEKVVVKKIFAQQVEKGHIPDKYFSDNDFPAGMELYQFTQKVHLKNLPEWKWTKATPFTNKPEQALALKRAYLDLWYILAEKDNAAIKKTFNESLQAWAITTGESVDDIYSDLFFDLKDPSFKMIPINWSDYEIEVMNDQRMLRFINKSDPTFSPISYFTDEGGERFIGSFSPIFSFIDGRFIPVI